MERQNNRRQARVHPHDGARQATNNPPLASRPGDVPRRHTDAGGEVLSPDRRIDTIDAPLLY